MTGADLLLYRRMRGIFWGLLVVGLFGIPLLTSLAWTVPAQLGWYNEGFVEEVGTPNAVISSGVGFASLVGVLAAVILGSTAGSIDYQRGVLRDLVLAGKARWAIVVGRLAGAVTWLLAFTAAAYAATFLLAVTLAPLEEEITWSEHGWSALSLAPMIAVSLLLATGVAMLVGSRGPAIAVYFVFALLADNILSALPKVGEWWQEISLGVAQSEVIAWIEGGAKEFESHLDRSPALAMVVLACWGIVPLAAGLVRLSKRDL